MSGSYFKEFWRLRQGKIEEDFRDEIIKGMIDLHLHPDLGFYHCQLIIGVVKWYFDMQGFLRIVGFMQQIESMGGLRLPLDCLDDFWELMDEILNALLFMLIGLEMLVMPFTPALLIAGLAAIMITLFARWASVGGAVLLMRTFRPFSPGAVKILTWGGLRGGISVALALSIPAVPERSTIVTITYIIVVFSIITQGMTLGRLVKQIYPDVEN